MSRASQIVVLCEDKAHEVFITRFLKKSWKVNPRSIRVLAYPSGKGSGRKFVEDYIADEVKAQRIRQARSVLIVVRDADELPATLVRDHLLASVVPPRAEHEPIVCILPRWSIQTWIAYLAMAGKNVDESDKVTYVRQFGAISETKQVHQYVDALGGRCKENRPLALPPESLMQACEEFDRIREIL